ncbi:MAG: hypothetical protein OXC03_05305 [Flavobacteriaceae bacterium]|nr:hypothetical protein [Flavobacteriaceae bacterium]
MQLQNRNSLYPAVLAMLILFSCARGDGELPPPNLVTPPEVEPPSKFAIATSAGEGGSITDNQNVDSGQSVEITATAQEHYQLKQWTGDCGSFSPDNSEITFTASKNCEIRVEFEKISYSITAISKGGVVCLMENYQENTGRQQFLLLSLMRAINSVIGP